MKKNIKVILPAVVLLLIGSVQISAASNPTTRGAFNYGNQTDVLFDGSVTFEQTDLGAGLCEEKGGYSFINWTESGSSESSHRLVFRINGKRYTAKYLENLKFKTGTIKGDEYNLYGNREHIIDPTTRIVGSWVV